MVRERQKLGQKLKVSSRMERKKKGVLKGGGESTKSEESERTDSAHTRHHWGRLSLKRKREEERKGKTATSPFKKKTKKRKVEKRETRGKVQSHRRKWEWTSR